MVDMKMSHTAFVMHLFTTVIIVFLSPLKRHGQHGRFGNVVKG